MFKEFLFNNITFSSLAYSYRTFVHQLSGFIASWFNARGYSGAFLHVTFCSEVKKGIAKDMDESESAESEVSVWQNHWRHNYTLPLDEQNVLLCPTTNKS